MIKLTPKVTLFDIPPSIYECNCILVEDDVTCLIETATTEEIYHSELRPRKIDVIINSHAHLDHNYRNYQFPEASLLLHSDDHILAASRKSFHTLFLPDMQGDELINLIKARYTFIIRPADGSIYDHQVLDFGQTRIEVMHLPGHTPGHCGFLFQDYGMVYSGDIDLNPFGPWYANANSDIDQFAASIDRLAGLHPEVIIPAHGSKLYDRNIPALLAAFRDKMFEREARIVRCLYQGKKTIPDIVAQHPIYHKYYDDMDPYFEYIMVYVHLKRLESLGKVVKQDQTYFLADGVRPSNLNLG